MTSLSIDDAGMIAEAFCASVAKRKSFAEPYPWHLVDDLFPAQVTHALATLPFPAPALGGVSGTREVHNDTRSYFDVAQMAKYPVMRAVAEAL